MNLALFSLPALPVVLLFGRRFPDVVSRLVIAWLVFYVLVLFVWNFEATIILLVPVILVPVILPWFGAGLVLRWMLRSKGEAEFLFAIFGVWVVAVVILSVLFYTLGDGSRSISPAWVTVILGSTGGTACLAWVVGITNYKQSKGSGYRGVFVGSVVATVAMTFMMLISVGPPF